MTHLTYRKIECRTVFYDSLPVHRCTLRPKATPEIAGRNGGCRALPRSSRSQKHHAQKNDVPRNPAGL